MTDTVWQFQTARLSVWLNLTYDPGYRYDGDDEDGETQAKLDSGEYIAFDSEVVIELDGMEIAADYLGASVYSQDNASEFWTAHRDTNPMNRNCSIMRQARGHNVTIGHYFPDMVRIACQRARATISKLQSFPLRTA